MEWQCSSYDDSVPHMNKNFLAGQFDAFCPFNLRKHASFEVALPVFDTLEQCESKWDSIASLCWTAEFATSRLKDILIWDITLRVIHFC